MKKGVAIALGVAGLSAVALLFFGRGKQSPQAPSQPPPAPVKVAQVKQEKSAEKKEEKPEVRVVERKKIDLVHGWVAFVGTYAGDDPSAFVPAKVVVQNPPADFSLFPSPPMSILESSKQVAGAYFYVRVPQETDLSVMVEPTKTSLTEDELVEIGWTSAKAWCEVKNYASARKKLLSFPVYIYVDKALIAQGNTGEGVVAGKVRVAEGYHEIQVLVAGNVVWNRCDLKRGESGNLYFLPTLRLKVGTGLNVPSAPSEVFVRKEVYEKYAGKLSETEEKLLKGGSGEGGEEGKGEDKAQVK